MRRMTRLNGRPSENREATALVHCPLCTRNVPGKVLLGRRAPVVRRGQKCPRCSAPLDAGYVLSVLEAA